MSKKILKINNVVIYENNDFKNIIDNIFDACFSKTECINTENDILILTNHLLNYYDLIKKSSKGKNNYYNYLVKYILYICGFKKKQGGNGNCSCHRTCSDISSENELVIINNDYYFLENKIKGHENICNLFKIFNDLIILKYDFGFLNKCFEVNGFHGIIIDYTCFINNTFYVDSNILVNILCYYYFNYDMVAYLASDLVNSHFRTLISLINMDTLNYKKNVFDLIKNKYNVPYNVIECFHSKYPLDIKDIICDFSNYNKNFYTILLLLTNHNEYFENDIYVSLYNKQNNDINYNGVYLPLLTSEIHTRLFIENLYNIASDKTYKNPRHFINPQHFIKPQNFKKIWTPHIFSIDDNEDDYYEPIDDFALLLFFVISFKKYPNLITEKNIRFYFNIYSTFSSILEICNIKKSNYIISENIEKEISKSGIYIRQIYSNFTSNLIHDNYNLLDVNNINFAYRICNTEMINMFLTKNNYPTSENFNLLLNNVILKKIVKLSKIKYHCEKYMGAIISHLELMLDLVKKLLNYKILPAKNSLKLLCKIISVFNLINPKTTKKSKKSKKQNLTDNINNINNIKNIILEITKLLSQYNYPVDEDLTFIFLCLGKTEALNNIMINENLYYKLYKILQNNITKLDNKYFTNPLHIMRNMCFKNTLLDDFIDFIKKHNLTPDRYCFKFAASHNEPIATWLINNKCFPTLGLLTIKYDYYTKLCIKMTETQEYMMQSYEHLIIN
ncbi:hypothetical protein Hokovirus_3_174 [Hokovirus HKV1]|uniref:Uncharacterized protein n=1 Tax=Hokovirus HKV1 TaxID=1977638 RepID=A0A1V0SGV4_9VIRU|nr:hypothetical protein Hokovirus_3_174 [Hokovirus HKV1]